MKRHLKWLFKMVLCIIFLSMPLNYLAEVTLAVARFEFTKSSFQVGEAVTVIDSSVAPAGRKITRYEWKTTINGKKKTSSNIKTLMKDAKVGEYQVTLRVKDNKGNWSEGVSKKVKIVAAQKLKITSFKSNVSVYDIGQKLDLTYTYDNPNDLEITAQRWRYKNLTTKGSTISGKPSYFKKAGTYEITLELQDEWGNWSNKATVKVVVGSHVTERNEYYLFEKGKPGDLVEGYIDKDYNSFDSANIVEIEDTPGTLIMSNSPETIPSSGVLYQDTVQGKGRILVHHANGTEYTKKLMILATTTNKQPVKLQVSNESIKGAGRHTLKLGQSAVYSYFQGSKGKSYTIKPGQVTCIYNSGAWKAGEVVTGTIDFTSEGNVTWQVVAMDEKSSIENLSKLSILPRDMHDRGTFNVIERRYTLDLTNVTDLKKLVLGKERDEWLDGVDALTGEIIKCRGNYGVPIKISIKNNEDMGVIINARGGGYLGALKWNKTKVFNVPTEEVLKEHKVMALVGTIKANTTNEIEYMLPNGSSAPILFGFIPKSMWK